MKGTEPWHVPGKWSTSKHNWAAEAKRNWSLLEHVVVHDVTLRDGEQTPGVVFRKAEKVRLAHELADAGVQRIEGGMAAVSEEDAEAIALMSREIKGVEIASFCRVRKGDVDLSLKCNVHRVIVELSALEGSIASLFGDRQRAVDSLVEVVSYAKKQGLQVTVFLMESSRADLEILESLIVPSVKEGKADSVALVDTRGCLLPGGAAFLVKKYKEWTDLPVEIHCHNVWGLGTANTLAGVSAGAEVVHTCVNGLGGNVALDECVMGLEGMMGMDTGVQTDRMLRLSKLTREFSGLGWYKPFVGDEVSFVEAGMPVKTMWEKRHEPGMGREFLNYEVVGGASATVVLGKKSGRYSIMLKCWSMGLSLPSEDQCGEMLSQVKALSIQEKRLVRDEEFGKIYDRTMGR